MREAASYELVVIGMGAAGLSAAVSFAEASTGRGGRSRVAVLERAPERERGGATRYTSSWFRITEDRRLDPGFVELMESVSEGLADLEYCRVLEREVPATLDFLDRHGIEVTWARSPLPNRHAGGGGDAGRRGGRNRRRPGRGPRAHGRRGARLRDGGRAAVRGSGRARGRVVARGRDGLLRRLGAGAVVIASGGFEGSKEMLAEYLGERAGELPLIAPGLAHNRGEGIRMVMEVGADTAGQFDMFHAEPVDPRATKPDPVFFPYVCGIVVNGSAMRFFDEGRAGFDSTFEALGYEIWRHQEQTAFFVGDRTTLAIEGFHELVLTDIPPVAAATIRELARELGRSMLRCLTLGRLAGAHAASSATRRRAGHPARARAPGDTPVQFRDVTLAENHTEEDA